MGIDAIVFDFAVILTATTAPIPVSKQLAIVRWISYFKGVNKKGFNSF